MQIATTFPGAVPLPSTPGIGSSPPPVGSPRPQDEDRVDRCAVRPHPSYVHHGALAVDASIEKPFERAEAYLRHDSSMRAVFDRAEHGARPTTVAASGTGDCDRYVPSRSLVEWNPHSGLALPNGRIQSPALGLGHELDHATVDPHVAARGRATFDAGFDTLEERRVILGSERHAARTLGEPERSHHDGRSYDVSSPIAHR